MSFCCFVLLSIESDELIFGKLIELIVGSQQAFSIPHKIKRERAWSLDQSYKLLASCCNEDINLNHILCSQIHLNMSGVNYSAQKHSSNMSAYSLCHWTSERYCGCVNQHIYSRQPKYSKWICKMFDQLGSAQVKNLWGLRENSKITMARTL